MPAANSASSKWLAQKRGLSYDGAPEEWKIDEPTLKISRAKGKGQAFKKICYLENLEVGEGHQGERSVEGY